MNKALAWAKRVWASLPHQAQAAAVAFATAALTTLGKELDSLLSGTQSFTWLMLRHDIAAAVIAGALATRAFYMWPSGSLARLLAPALPVSSSAATSPASSPATISSVSQPPATAEKSNPS
jgi:hypothetical protein